MTKTEKLQLIELTAAVNRLAEESSTDAGRRDEVLRALGRLDEKVEDVAAKVDAVEEVLYKGNGDSLLTQIRLYGDRLTRLEEAVKTKASGILAYPKELLGGLGAVLLVLAYAIAKLAGLPLP